MKIHQPFKKLIEYKAFSIKMSPTDLVLRFGKQNQSLLIEKRAGCVKCTETTTMDKTRTCYIPICLVSNTFTFTTLRALPVLTSLPTPKGSPWPSALGWVEGWALNARLCHHPPRVPPTSSAPGPTKPHAALTIFIDENWGISYF